MNIETVEKLANIAHIALTEEEMASIKNDLSEVLIGINNMMKMDIAINIANNNYFQSFVREYDMTKQPVQDICDQIETSNTIRASLSNLSSNNMIVVPKFK